MGNRLDCRELPRERLLHLRQALQCLGEQVFLLARPEQYAALAWSIASVT